MKKVVNVSLGGRNYTLEEDAYARLGRYLEHFRARLTVPEGQKTEVMDEIEGRLAELFSREVGESGRVVSLDLVNRVASTLGMPDGSAEDGFGTSSSASEPASNPRKLYRDMDEKKIAGVCSGLSYYFDIDVVLVRIIMLAALIFGSAIYICTETALRHFHKNAPTRNLKLATTIVLGIVTLIAVLLGLETTGISSGIAASCCIGIGSILALMQPAKTAEASSDDDLQWLRNAIAVLAFAPLTFAVMRAFGMQATGGGFIFFWVCGVLAPLFWYSGYHFLEEQFEFDLRYGHLLRYDMLEKGARTAWAWTKKASVATWKGAKKALRATYRGIIAACAAVGRGIKRIGQGFKDILSASNPEDE